MSTIKSGSGDLAGGGRTNVYMDLLAEVSPKHESLKTLLDELVKQWQESTERYHAAAGSDNINGNLQQQSAQAKQDSDQHSKATGDRTQKTADSSKEAHQKYEGTEGDNSTALKDLNKDIPGGFQAPAATQGGATTAEFRTPASTQGGANFQTPTSTQGGLGGGSFTTPASTQGGLNGDVFRTPAATQGGPVEV
ncbi:MAG: hypothetical protein ACRC20_13760 [Segniliparus sp.]|uniref:hypothetical protein n=1 Tax=Segniliparus sp. TaxID=2804064 RepID=UPI003F399FD8